MNSSTDIKQITAALLEAQKAMKPAKKTAKNPFYGSMYAPLNSVIETIKDNLNSHDITCLQPIDGEYVETVLIHTSGEWISSKTPIVPKVTKVTNKDGVITETISDPQATGSAISYARRYALNSMLLMEDEDDDGQAAMKSPLASSAPPADPAAAFESEMNAAADTCTLHNKPLVYRIFSDTTDHRMKGILSEDGTLKYHESGSWYACDGKGWKIAPMSIVVDKEG